MATVKAQGSSLSITYADDGGYTIKDEKSGATLQFKLGGNGLIDSIDYKPGNPDDKTPALQIQYIGQEANGLISFSLLWSDNYVTDFRASALRVIDLHGLATRSSRPPFVVATVGPPTKPGSVR